MTQRFSFSISDALPAAWKLIWADNLNTRAKGYDFRGNTYYATAADLENQVRQFADETAAGEAWGTRGRTCGRPMSVIRFSGDLQAACRHWLQGEVARGRLVTHNFKKGHISGARFRPAGEPLSEAEQKTFAEIVKPPRPTVYHAPGKGGPLCTDATRSRFARSQAWVTSDPEKVTCPRCKNLSKGA